MQLSTKMAEVLGDRVHLNEPVIRVEQSDDGVTVTTSTGNVYNVSMINHNASQVHQCTVILEFCLNGLDLVT